MKLSAGDLVIDNGIWNNSDGVCLYDRPPNLDGATVTATLRPGTAALIIKLDRSDACCVYLLTCTGAGWTLGAYLCKVNT